MHKKAVSMSAENDKGEKLLPDKIGQEFVHPGETTLKHAVQNGGRDIGKMYEIYKEHDSMKRYCPSCYRQQKAMAFHEDIEFYFCAYGESFEDGDNIGVLNYESEVTCLHCEKTFKAKYWLNDPPPSKL